MKLKPRKIFCFEGPDGVGKSTVASGVLEHLRLSDTSTTLLAFPGHAEGSLGRWVYEMHHDASLLRHPPSSTALQALHIAAHIDALETTIPDALTRCEVLLLDRYWWSALIYGASAGANLPVLEALVEAEQLAWGPLADSVTIYLLDCDRPWRISEDTATWYRIAEQYRELAKSEQAGHAKVIENTGDVSETVARIVEEIVGELGATDAY